MGNVGFAGLLGASALLVAVVAGAIVAPGAPGRASAQSGDAILRVTGPVEPVNKGDKGIPFDITIENVTNLAGFSFVLTYDADILEFSGNPNDAQKGDFLGSSGREVVCGEPVKDAGSMRMNCVTARPEPAGARGSGKLATVLLNATGSGTTEVTLTRMQLLEVSEKVPVPQIKSTVEGTSIVVKGGGGFNWLIWGPIIVVAVLVIAGIGAFATMRMRSTSSRAAAV